MGGHHHEIRLQIGDVSHQGPGRITGRKNILVDRTHKARSSKPSHYVLQVALSVLQSAFQESLPRNLISRDGGIGDREGHRDQIEGSSGPLSNRERNRNSVLTKTRTIERNYDAIRHKLPS
jgi:hypothetical protein